MQENNTQAAIDAGKEIAAATLQKLQDYNGIPFTLSPKGELSVQSNLLRELDGRAPVPRVLSGLAKLTDESSFIAHVNRFKDGQSAIFVLEDGFLAVFDYHRAMPQDGDLISGRDGAARWGRHRAQYTPPLSAEWKTWTGQAGKMVEQVPFADFLEVNIADIAGPVEGRNVPTPADLYTVATKLKILSNDTCESSIDRNTGEHTIIAKVEHNTTGTSTIPREFDLNIAVFENGAPQRVTCKFRLSKSNGVKFGFVIPTADRDRRLALRAIRDRLGAATGLPVFAGAPEQ